MTYEPFTQEQEDAVFLYRCMTEFAANGQSQLEWAIRMRLAEMNCRNQWTMADVAAASRLNYWPPISRDSISWTD